MKWVCPKIIEKEERDREETSAELLHQMSGMCGERKQRENNSLGL